jgi:hypothetical protein
MNEELILLASAYLDGDVTVDERALVETDPALLAEVEQLRAVRALLADTEPPKISVRESHLAAAFDVWDRLPDAERAGLGRDATPTDRAAAAGAASVMAPASLRDRRRPTTTRWLTGAAAALVLVLAGGLVVQLTGAGGSDDDSSTADSADSAETAEPAETSGDAAASLAAEGGQDEEGADGAVPESAEDAAADEDVRLDTGVDEPPPPREDEALQQLFTPQDLADFAAPAFGAPQAPDVPAATSAPVEPDLAPSAIGVELPLCLSADIVVGPALYGDTLVVVGIDEGRGLALAYLGDTCTEIARVQLDQP